MKKALLLVVALSALAAGTTAQPADAHRHVCHTQHTCPSDHHTYVWRKLNCAHVTSPKYNRVRDKILVKYAGRRYYCRRV